MHTSRSFLLHLGLSLIVSTGTCSCKPLGNEVATPEEFYPLQPDEDLIEEEDMDAKMESLLGTMKENFLRKLNLSDVPQEQSKISPPQFMMELYNKYATDSSEIPQSDVIRSFTVQDVTLSETNGTKSKLRLLFNVSIPSHEKVTAAELQLFFLPDIRSTVISQVFEATVKVYQVQDGDSKAATLPLDRRGVKGSQSMWVTMDVTAAIRSKRMSGHGVAGFDVVIDQKNCADKGCFNMCLSIGLNTSAALIVFSDDLGSRRREIKKELREMMIHEEETILQSGGKWNRYGQMENTIPEARHARRKRKAETGYCRRTSLKVNFNDIGWDSWIVAPPQYDAYECRGLCYHPLTDESTPSKHALIQTLINIRNPNKANMACCVPIKLDPITVMYQENGRLTIRYLYEEMKVAECGCR
ncbi:growth/differentiation factor 2 [Synchiropus picturatus]